MTLSEDEAAGEAMGIEIEPKGQLHGNALSLPVWPPDRHSYAVSNGFGQPTYKPETDFRRSLEGGLRTALATLLALLWSNYGPLPAELQIYKFFMVVVAIVVYRSTIGEVIFESMAAIQGGIFGCAFVAVARAICGADNLAAAGIGVFVCIFLVVRARRLSSIARKLGCTAVLMGLLAFRTEPFPRAWLRQLGLFLFTFPQGAIFALLANIVPWPRFAVREAALRGQYSCQVLAASVYAAVLSFLQCRDERAFAEAALLSEQLKRSVQRIKSMRRWMELELLVVAFGFWRRGVMNATQALARLAEVETQLLDCLTGLRLALAGIENSVEQQEFLAYLHEPMSNVALCASEVCEDTACTVSLRALRRVIWHGCSCGPRTSSRRPSRRGSDRNRWQRQELQQGGTPEQSKAAINKALANLGAAMEVLVDEYDLARVRLLYGMEDRVLSPTFADILPPQHRQQSHQPPFAPTATAPWPAKIAAAATAGAFASAADAAVDGAKQRSESTATSVSPAGSAASPKASEDCQRGRRTGGAALKAAVAAAASAPSSPLAMRSRDVSPARSSDAASESNPSSPRRPQFRGSISHRITDYHGYLSMAAFVFSLVNLCLALGNVRGVSEALVGSLDDEADASGSEDDGEAADLGAAAAEAAADSARLESGKGGGGGVRMKANAAVRKRRCAHCTARWPNRSVRSFGSHFRSVANEALALFLKGFGPSPELLSAFSSSKERVMAFVRRRTAARGDAAAGQRALTVSESAAERLWQALRFGCSVHGNREQPQQPPQQQSGHEEELEDVLGRQEEGRNLALFGKQLGLRRKKQEERRWRSLVMWGRRNHQNLLHPLKLAAIATVCSLFALVPALEKAYAPGVWVSFTAVFVMSSDSSSGFVTSSLRLIGTVFGSMYGYLVANLVGIEIGTYSWQLLLILPGWVGACCCFRFGASGYAAVVAAFTAVLLFTGTFTIQSQGSLAAFSRMQNTVIGLLIYVVMDNLIVPVRAKSLLRQHVYTALHSVSQEVAALEGLLFPTTLDETDETAEGPLDSPTTASAARVSKEHERAKEASRIERLGMAALDVSESEIPSTPNFRERTDTAADRDMRSRALTMLATGSLATGEIGAAAAAAPVACSPKPGAPDAEAIAARGAQAAAILTRGECDLPESEPEAAQTGTAGGLLEEVKMEPAGECSAESVARQAEAEGRSGQAAAAPPQTSPAGEAADEAPDRQALLHVRSSSRSAFFRHDAVQPPAPNGPQAAGEGAEGGERAVRTNSIFSSRQLSEALTGGRSGWKSAEKLLPEVSARLATLQRALGAQATCVRLAALEPSLWHRPFHAESYQRLLAAQEDMYSALVLLARATTAFRSICSTQKWRVELRNISSIIVRLRALLRHIRGALGDAEGAFSVFQLVPAEEETGTPPPPPAGRGVEGTRRRRRPSAAAAEKGKALATAPAALPVPVPVPEGGLDALSGGVGHAADAAHPTTRFGSVAGNSSSLPLTGGGGSVMASQRGSGFSFRGSLRAADERHQQRTQQALHLLELQVQARRLEKCINNEWLRYVRRLVATREQQPLSLEFVIRFNTVVFAVQSLQRGLLQLAHALLEVLERERFAYYYS